jgi:hypothetical protein
MTASNSATRRRTSTSVVVVKALGIELHFSALIAVLVGAAVLVALGLGFAFAALLHLTSWADVDGIARLLKVVRG